jgi:outer membrane protein assembly factor BamB
VERGAEPRQPHQRAVRDPRHPGPAGDLPGDVFAVSHSGVFAATDLRTGQARWTLPVVGVTAPLAGRRRCLCGGQGRPGDLRGPRERPDLLDQEPQRGLQVQAQGRRHGVGGQKQVRPIWSSPLLSNDRLLIVGQTGQMVVMNAKTGEIQKRIELRGRP